MTDFNERVVPLDELPDYRVAEGEPDVRGWDVFTSDGAKIGEVDTLLVDPAAKKVRYLDVELTEAMGVARSSEDPHVLIPIGRAQVQRSDERVRLSGFRSADVGLLPPYNHERITPEFEAVLRARFDGGFKGTAAERDFYMDELYDESRFYGRAPGEGEERLTLSEEELVVGKREVAAGEVTVEKEVDVEHVRESVPVVREEVTVERRPATPGMAAEARIEEDRIRVPVKREELVVGKRVTPREEVVVRKRETIDTEILEADLRRERAEVHRQGRAELRGDG